MKKQERNNKSMARLYNKRRSSAGKEFNIIKTHKEGNSIRLLKTGCNTTIENLSRLIERICAPLTNNIDARINDTEHLLQIIDYINTNELANDRILVSFDIVNMFRTLTTLKVFRQ